MDLVGHDVANVNTPGHAQSRAIQTAQDPGTAVSSLQKIEPASPEASATDLAEEATEEIEVSAAYSANLRALSVRDSMTGDLLDLLA